MKRIITTTILSTLIASGAFAANLGTANTFNAFIFGNANVSGGDAEGAVAIGGSWTVSDYTVTTFNKKGTIGALNNISAYVGGSVSWNNSGHVNNGGNTYVGGSICANQLDLNGGGTVYYGGAKSGTIQGGPTSNTNLVNPTVFAQQKTYSINQSSYLAGLAGTAINTNIPNTWTLAVTSGLNVFTIDGSKLGSPRNIDFTGLQSNSTIVINVTGNVNSFGSLITSGYEQVVWNFVNATTINIDQRDLNGSVLAPYATVNQNKVINGTLIANEWNSTGNVELHSHIFMGDLGAPHTPSVPGPAAVLPFGSALIAGLIRRRKRA